MNLPEILDLLGVRYWEEGGHHHVRPGNLGIDCPQCSPGSGAVRFSMRLDNPWRCGCWLCGKVGLVETLAEASGRGRGEILSLLGRSERPHQVKTEKPAGKLQVPEGVGPLLKVHKDYLRKRGFNPAEVSERWGVGGIGLHHRLAWRLFIPVKVGEETVSWTTRAVSDDAAKRYDSAKSEEEKQPAKSVLYGGGMARHAIILVEGPLDAWAVGPGGCAVMGVGFTRRQVLAASRFPVRAVAFDGDAAGQKRAREFCTALEGFPGVTTNVVLSTGKDASRASKNEVDQLRRRFLS